jgi:hypothetical protein
MNIFYRLAIISLFLLIQCSKNKIQESDNIAVVNGINIILEDFRNFYELDPNFGIDSVGYPALLDELNRYIDHKLTYQLAEKEGLFKDSLFRRSVAWETRQAILRQLFREVVSNKISITEDELKEEYIRENIQVHVRHLFTTDSAQANRWYKELKKGNIFNKLAKVAFTDTVLANNGGDLGWIELSSLDENFAQGVEVLTKNEISRPIRTKWGYHIVQLIDRKENLLLKESDFIQKKKAIEKKIRVRKENELSKNYIKLYIGELNPQPNAKTFRLLWQSIASDEGENKRLSSITSFTNNLISELQIKLQNHRNDILIKYKRGEVTLNEYLSALKKIPVSERPRFQTVHQLSDKIGVWIRDELLFKEALDRGLQNHQDVLKEVYDIQESQSYYYLIDREVKTLTVPDEVKDYFKEKNKSILKSHRKLRRFHTVQDWMWWKAQTNLHYKLNHYKTSIEIDYDKLRVENSQIDWKNRVRMLVIQNPS